MRVTRIKRELKITKLWKNVADTSRMDITADENEKSSGSNKVV